MKTISIYKEKNVSISSQVSSFLSKQEMERRGPGESRSVLFSLARLSLFVGMNALALLPEANRHWIPPINPYCSFFILAK